MNVKTPFTDFNVRSWSFRPNTEGVEGVQSEKQNLRIIPYSPKPLCFYAFQAFLPPYLQKIQKKQLKNGRTGKSFRHC